MLSRLSKALLGCLFVCAAATGANALTVGGFDFDDDAGVDQLQSSSDLSTFGGGFFTPDSLQEVEAVLTDDSVSTNVLFNSGAIAVLSFVDNILINGSGNDLVIFETGNPDFINVTINNTTLAGQAASTGINQGTAAAINALEIELSNFGVLDGEQVSQISVAFVFTPPSIGFVGALNSQSLSAIPLPTPVFLLLASLACFGVLARRGRTV